MARHGRFGILFCPAVALNDVTVAEAGERAERDFDSRSAGAGLSDEAYRRRMWSEMEQKKRDQEQRRREAFSFITPEERRAQQAREQAEAERKRADAETSRRIADDEDRRAQARHAIAAKAEEAKRETRAQLEKRWVQFELLAERLRSTDTATSSSSSSSSSSSASSSSAADSKAAKIGPEPRPAAPRITLKDVPFPWIPSDSSAAALTTSGFLSDLFASDSASATGQFLLRRVFELTAELLCSDLAG